MATTGRKRKATWKVLANIEEKSHSSGMQKESNRRSTRPKMFQSVTTGTPDQMHMQSRKPDAVSKDGETVEKAVSPAGGKAKRSNKSGDQTKKNTGGKGKGNKGKNKAEKPSEEEIITDLRRQRKTKIQQEVHKLNEDKAKELLSIAAERDPSMLHLIEKAVHEDSSEPPDSPAPRPPDVPAWCICGHCREMASDIEKRCCRRNPQNCLSETMDFANLVLDPMVLYIFRMYRADLFAIGNLDEGDLNRQNRHAAYRCYILWQYGRLQSGDRRVIPSCVVWKIRDRYPDPFDQYRGFIRGRLG